MAVTFFCLFSCSRRLPVTFDALLLVLYWSADDFLFCFTNVYWHAWTFLHKIFFKLCPVGNATLNPNFFIFYLFISWFLVQFFVSKSKVCFLSVLLLLLLSTIRVFFSRLLIVFCNVFRSYPFSQNISARYSISAIKYFSEQILVALTRNFLNMLVILLESIQECGLICTFVRAGLRWTSNSYLPLFFLFLCQENLNIFLHFRFLL